MAWLNERRPDWSRGDLLPVVVTDADDGALLMLGWADAGAVDATERTGEAHFWSRSRRELWRKGATSGNVLAVVEMAVDCDADAIVYRVRPAGPACHTGARSCFDDVPRFGLAALERVIAERRREADPAASYTARLLAGGARRPAEKVTEEAGELSAAALAGTDDEVVSEAADLAYHLLVLLSARRIGLERVEAELARRHGTTGAAPS
ncbi:MAG TPA: bifunctional phosphoribosyl-AMP cyclohydrolase/phosphoribosyl-ATP diphosphatase HisIE [Candidatus Limnocylindrales bacterium]|nr:bifunctional phosphoribosyl-AMP cyclohydrolase/phosphoribosyl-ATP diphosphatase HisIE [Candidatus Limnocylindrales bacterium]